MKRLFLIIALLLPMLASAQNEKTLISSNDSIPSMIERLIAQKDSAKWGGYQPRKLTSHINLEFVTSANAYLTDGNFDEAAYQEAYQTAFENYQEDIQKYVIKR